MTETVEFNFWKELRLIFKDTYGAPLLVSRIRRDKFLGKVKKEER